MNRTDPEFLLLAYPFSALPRQAVLDVLPRVAAEILPEGRSLPGQDPPEAVRVLARGAVELCAGETRVQTLLEAGILGFEPLFGGPALAALALEESLLLRLSLEDFRVLTASAEVQAHFQRLARARTLALERAAEAVSAAGRNSADPFLGLRIRDVPGRTALFVLPEASVAEAARRMAELDLTCCLAGTPDQPLGIVTERDVLKKVVAPGADPRTLRVAEIMSAPVIAVARDDLLFEAFSSMVRHGIRRLCVRDESGRALVVLGEGDLLSARGENPASLSRETSEAVDAQGLARARAKMAKMAVRGLEEGIAVERIGRLVSDLHDQLMCRAMDLAAPGGPGEEPPASFALLALGSEGRKEQCLGTDQDNALVFDPAPGREDAAREHFLTLGRGMEDLLVQAGVPPCPHGVMVSNPRWNMTLDEWRTDLAVMFERGDEEAMLRLSLLADARLVRGEATLARELRDTLVRRARAAPIILKYMAREALRFTPPLGFFNSLSVEKAGPRKGALDIKKGGVFPLTQGVKTLALDLDLPETSTPRRLAALADRGVLSGSTAEALAEALALFQTLRARFQARSLRAERPLDNDIFPDRLASGERERLKNAFKAVADFQSLLFNRYGLRLLT